MSYFMTLIERTPLIIRYAVKVSISKIEFMKYLNPLSSPWS